MRCQGFARLVAVVATFVVVTPAIGQRSIGQDPGTGSSVRLPGFMPTPAPEPLLGNLGPIRPLLQNAGVDFGINYKGEGVTNVTGGTSQRAVAVGQLLIGATFDLEKIIGLQGGTLRASVTRRHGPDLGAVAGLDTLQLPAEVYGTGRIWRYAELWYQQILADGLVVARVGRLSSFDFASFDCEFTNLALCGAPPGNVVPSYLFVFPATSWMGWLKVQDRGFHIKVGLQEDNLNNIKPGFYLSRGGARGVIYHGEVGWTPVFGGGQLPGRYRAGAWRTSASDEDVLLGVDGTLRADLSTPALRRTGPYGFYVQGQQHLTGSATEDPVTGRITRRSGLNAFFNYVRTDPRTARIIDQVNAGVYFNGPLAARPDDYIGVGAARTRYNPRAAAAEAAANPRSARRGAEIEIEAHYGIRVTPGFTLKPSIQYIVSPGGRKVARNATVLGIRVEVDF